MPRLNPVEAWEQAIDYNYYSSLKYQAGVQFLVNLADNMNILFQEENPDWDCDYCPVPPDFPIYYEGIGDDFYDFVSFFVAISRDESDELLETLTRDVSTDRDIYAKFNPRKPQEPNLLMEVVCSIL